ncbi:hypothetical protein ACIBCH_04080 [Amycolatopsis thailandensis]|uniref:hypothetical protein n=1 Tax=Amycolatopsis thailandensis TaxID=589330 RepID=UPI00378C7287
MRAAELELADFLGWKEKVEPDLDWKEVQAELGFEFPAAHRDFLKIFPSGVMSEYIYIWSPVQSRRWLDAYKWKLKSKSAYFVDVRSEMPGDYPHLFHPEPGGLIPWAEGDEHTYFWRPVEGQAVDQWSIVFMDNTSGGWGEYHGTSVQFLLDLLTGALVSDILYSDWPKSERSYVVMPEPMLPS